MINPFLDACGATGPLLLGTESPGGPGVETRAFDLPFVLAGRDPRSDLRLTHPDVSDRHAYLQLVDGQLLCIDLGSRVGIYQGGKCQRLAYVERDQAVRVGPYRIRLLGGDAGGAATPEAACPPRSLALAHRAIRHTRCDLPRGLALVGSASDCQIRLIDPSVSNYHCSLVHTPQGVWVVDLLGQGGVRVNGREVGYARLHEDDALRVGHSEIRLVAASDHPGPECAPALARPDAGEPDAQAVELIERVLGPMVSQVGHLQQQMVEEFHQARAILFDTFTALHQEQTAAINQELEQIRQVSQELHALRADLERQTRLLTDHVQTSASATRPVRLSLGGPAAHPNGRGNGEGDGVYTPAPAAFLRPDPANGAIVAHNEQAHARLCLRIAGLKTRQQTRWEKLMAMFPGATPGYGNDS